MEKVSSLFEKIKSTGAIVLTRQEIKNISGGFTVYGCGYASGAFYGTCTCNISREEATNLGFDSYCCCDECYTLCVINQETVCDEFLWLYNCPRPNQGC